MWSIWMDVYNYWLETETYDKIMITSFLSQASVGRKTTYRHRQTDVKTSPANRTFLIP